MLLLISFVYDEAERSDEYSGNFIELIKIVLEHADREFILSLKI